ncbi:serine/threonine-protein kinase/endoribonuclease IRE1a-like protein [Tanacetum coccineum]|uniref:Serine/threonine-protein kinase/endoribonuclease IRE1a-like protein n=1 Tax=Tanacetum coccineum TaxID=301880 RepID=A0ABQ4WSQ6_9ASTR
MKLAAIMDQNGEIFLVNEELHSLYWGRQTLWPSYSLYVAKGVTDYLDFSCQHEVALSPLRVVSFNSQEPDIEKKRKDLESKLNLIYLGGDGRKSDLPSLGKSLLSFSTPEYHPPKDISSFLLQPFFWDPNTAIQFISTISDLLEGKWDWYQARKLVKDNINQNQVFTNQWFQLGCLTNVLDVGFVKERVAQRHIMPYDYTDGCDLVRIFRNGFSHHGEMDKKVREKVGKTKADIVLYLNSTFPKLVLSLHNAGLEIYRRDVVLLDPDKAPSNLGVFYEGRIRFGR